MKHVYILFIILISISCHNSSSKKTCSIDISEIGVMYPKDKFRDVLGEIKQPGTYSINKLKDTIVIYEISEQIVSIPIVNTYDEQGNSYDFYNVNIRYKIKKHKVDSLDLSFAGMHEKLFVIPEIRRVLQEVLIQSKDTLVVKKQMLIVEKLEKKQIDWYLNITFISIDKITKK